MKSAYNGCTVYFGDSLQARLREVGQYHRRWYVPSIVKYFQHRESITHGRILGLYGLRRTGKTVSALHAIASLPKSLFERTLYVTFNKPVDFSVLQEVMRDSYDSGFANVVLDEVTLIEDFAVWASYLANHCGKIQHVLVLGTDSYAIRDASKESLFDRIDLIHTTAITYKEANYLLGGLCLEDFVRYGGVLCGESKDKWVYRTWGSSYEYLNTSVAGNLYNAIRGKTDPLEYALPTDSGLLRRATFSALLFRVVNADHHRFTEDVLYAAFKEADVGASREGLVDLPGISTVLSTVDLYVGLLLDLDLSIPVLTEEDRRWYLHKLNELDVFFRYLTKEITFGVLDGEIVPDSLRVKNIFDTVAVHPGMRYSLAQVALESLRDNVDKRYLSKVSSKLESCCFGHVMEELLLRETSCFIGTSESISRDVIQLRVNGKEIDIFVRTVNYIYLIEVKHSSIVNVSQCKNLISEDVQYYISTYESVPIKRCVFYMGPTTTVTVEGYDILYQNIEEYLLDIKGFYSK